MSSSDHKVHAIFMDAYENHSNEIFRFCIIKVRNRDLATDLTQDAFTKTWEYLSGGKEVKNIRAFLYQVARNAIIDHSRKKSMTSLDSMQEDGYDFGHDDDITAQVDATDAAFSLKVLKEMKDADREVLILRYINDLSVTEIADILKEKENTVSVRIHRALGRAKDLIQQKHEEF